MNLNIGVLAVQVKAAVAAIGNLVQEQLQMKCSHLFCPRNNYSIQTAELFITYHY